MPFLFSSKLARGPSTPLKSEYQGVPITPNDTADVPIGPGGVATPCVAVSVTGAGNVAVQLATGGSTVLTGLVAGQIVDCGIKRILATGTTATGVFALYALER
jgi:hypothetical protein